MLDAAGVSASLALVNTSAQVRKDLPSLDQFNHMIVCVPAPSGELFLDCTAKGANLANPIAYGLAGREALILDRREPRFVRISDYPSNASVIRVLREVQLTNRTDALVRETLAFQGVHAAYLREYLRNQRPTERRAYVAAQLVGQAGELEDLSFDGLDRPALDLEVKFSYRVRGEFHALENQIVGSVPIGVERAYLLSEPIPKRATPFEVSVPLTIEGTVTVNSPAGFRPKPMPKPAPDAENRFVRCQMAVDASASGWRLRYHLHENAGRSAAESYTEYCRAMQQTADLLKPRLVCERVRP